MLSLGIHLLCGMFLEWLLGGCCLYPVTFHTMPLPWGWLPTLSPAVQCVGWIWVQKTGMQEPVGAAAKAQPLL